MALFLLFIAEELRVPFKTIAEHTASALIAATLIAFTYEYLLNSHREAMFRRLFSEHRERMFEALKVHLLLTPEEIFHLLADIAVQTKATPTLYQMHRVKDEYTFANSIDYFTTLIEVRRKEIVKVLATWVEPKSHVNLKFLGSDFIGMYRLRELVPVLRQQAMQSIDHLNDDNREWVLNYIWAVSRCEESPYRWLGELLVNFDDRQVQEWILFVPIQMPDEEFAPLIRGFLRRHGASARARTLMLAARALAAVERQHPGTGRPTFNEFRDLFAKSAEWDEIRRIWQDLGIGARRLEPQRMKGNGEREVDPAPAPAQEPSVDTEWTATGASPSPGGGSSGAEGRGGPRG